MNELITRLRDNFLLLLFIIPRNNLYDIEYQNKVYKLFSKIVKLCNVSNILIDYDKILENSIKQNHPVIVSYCLRLFSIHENKLNELKQLAKNKEYFNIRLLLHYNAKSYKTVFLIRHGQSYGNIKQWPQKYDPPLTNYGKMQSKKLRNIVRLYKLSKGKVYSSPLIRAIQTADYSIPSSTIINILPHHFEFNDRYKNEQEIESYFKNKRQLDFQEFKKYSAKTIDIANNYDFYNKKKRLDFFSKWLLKNNHPCITIYGHGYFYKLFGKLDYHMENTEILKYIIPIIN